MRNAIENTTDRLLADLTPRRIVAELDKYIVGQAAAKRSVAIALRNRVRRQSLGEDIKDEVIPKNILMIGPTGVGKTEIARRLARLVRAPFVKVEASKFTEVGYVGRDVDAMVRDLVEASVRMVRAEKVQGVQAEAQRRAVERILDALQRRGTGRAAGRMHSFGEQMAALLQQRPPEPPAEEEPTPDEDSRTELRRRLLAGDLDKQTVEIEVEENRFLSFPVWSSGGMEEMGMNLQDMLGGMFPKQQRRRSVTVGEARRILVDQEADRLIDMEQVTGDAVERAEQSGIIFIDEMDKIAGRERGVGPDVSREGVQRGLLPIVEGSTVMTKHGPVQTDHILFVAAGAFHTTKPSDLIPELQGRFPIRVELSALGESDFIRILNEPRNSLIRQYTALLETEGVELEFTPDGVAEIARIAAQVNQQAENIGARRLHTIMERVLEEISFEASDIAPTHVTITGDYVNQRLADVLKDLDLARYIL
jgi:ATP-dependent HslUV protease ATP-binding subunit HslU